MIDGITGSVHLDGHSRIIQIGKMILALAKCTAISKRCTQIADNIGMVFARYTTRLQGCIAKAEELADLSATTFGTKRK